MQEPVRKDGSRYFGPTPEKSRGGQVFYVHMLGEEVQRIFHLRVGPDGQLWHYVNGVYVPGGERSACEYVRTQLKPIWKKRHADEVIGWCKASRPSIPTEPHPDIINLANGLYDLRTGELAAHTPDFASTVQIPIEFHPNAACPLIEKFLGEVLSSGTESMIYEIAGYCLYALQPYRKAVLLFGSGGNGKSTFLSILVGLLGSKNVSSVALQDLPERFMSAELFGKLANICGDLDSRAVKRSDMFKKLTGGTDRIQAERKYAHPFSFLPFSTLIFSVNELPMSADQTEGFFDRWIIIPFPNRFEGTVEGDAGLSKALTAKEELEGFLVKALAGLQRLRQRGRFDPPPSVREALASYQTSADTVATFVQDKCLLGEGETSRADLYAAYQTYCRDSALQAVSSQSFCKRIRLTLGPDCETKGQSGQRRWRGILVEWIK